ncbi:transmembrane protein 200A [Denticeps clupeoides]|uniref:Transmembrane protein 200B n=1 Tax=Denticeps clupeoides TaxID=299321 RepID=A0AAY4E7W9_9TELE|nr:transmembrane protein 200A-like [Denticeps clupeoides]
MKSPKSRGLAPTSPTRQRLSRFRLRSRKKEGVIRGKLRIRSIPGAFLVLGIIVVVVGTALAVAGYWPYRTNRSALLGQVGGLSESPTQGWGLAAKGFLPTTSLIHSERMKLLGPVIMGVGLFILICANTVLYENRDRETQMLVAQMRSVICSVSAAVPSADLSTINPLANREYQWVSSLPAAHLNILCLQELTSSEPLLQTKGRGDDRLEHVLRTEVLHHQESSSTPSRHSSCNSSKVDFNICTLDLHTDPLFKLSNCLTASSMSTLEGESWEEAAMLPRRSHSLSYRTNPRTRAQVLIRLDGLALPAGHPDQLLRESSSEVCVNIASTLALSPAEDQRHCSWPRLDTGGARKYMKLENKEDSVDKLLNQLEHQCSQWDKSYGSGPFQ